MLKLNYDTLAVAQGRSVAFGASDGLEPYVFSLGEDSKGSIDPVSGVYTAPNEISFTEEIVVTDANGITDNAFVNVMEAIGLVADILQTYMGLDAQNVQLYNQKLKIPNNSKTYLSVGVMRSKPFGISKRHYEKDGKFYEEIGQNISATLTIDIYSKKEDVIFQKDEIVEAFASDYAQSQMMRNGFKISRLTGDFVSLSNIEGSAIPYRFQTTCVVEYAKTKLREVRYYDTFQEPNTTVNK